MEEKETLRHAALREQKKSGRKEGFMSDERRCVGGFDKNHFLEHCCGGKLASPLNVGLEVNW